MIAYSKCPPPMQKVQEVQEGGVNDNPRHLSALPALSAPRRAVPTQRLSAALWGRWAAASTIWARRGMTNRPARITQSEVARIIRAAKQEGASEVVVSLDERTVVVRLSTATDKPVEDAGEVIL
jgi:hypothetical protein